MSAYTNSAPPNRNTSYPVNFQASVFIGHRGTPGRVRSTIIASVVMLWPAMDCPGFRARGGYRCVVADLAESLARRFQVLRPHLSEFQRRLWLGAEAPSRVTGVWRSLPWRWGSGVGW